MTQGDEQEPSGALAEAVELDGVTPPAKGRRGRVVLWCTLVSVIVAAIAVIALRDPARTPDEDLARVRAFVASSATGRFEATTRSEYGAGPDEPGSRSIDVTQTEGSFAIPGRLHSVDDDGEFVFETIQLGAGMYFRTAEKRSELRDEPWIYSPTTVADLASGAGALDPVLAGIDAASLTSASSVLGAFGAPFDLPELLGRLDDVRRVSPGALEATTTVRELLPADMVASIEKEMAELRAEFEAEEGDEDFSDFETDFLDGVVTIRLTHASDGRLDELVISADTGQGEDRSLDRSALQFSAWGEPVTIDAPSAADVDLTPGIDEDDLAAFAAFPAGAPAAPPAGTVLHNATVTEKDAEIEECNSLHLSYGPPSSSETESSYDERSPFLEVTSTEASCESADRLMLGYYGDDVGEPEALRIGPFDAELRRSQQRDFGDGPDQAIIHVRFTTGGAVVDAHSNLPEDQVLAAMATHGPLDLASQPVDRSAPPPPGS